MSSSTEAVGPPHALVVGGTGMLYDVSLNLAVRGYAVSVVARGRGALEELTNRAALLGGRVVPVAVDYDDPGAWTGALQEIEEERGLPELAVVWMHGGSSRASETLLAWLRRREGKCRLVWVLGSAEADPSHLAPPVEGLEARTSSLRRQDVVLGFVVEGAPKHPRSRWLTNEEISRGVLLALEEGRTRTIVGQVEPWSMRP